LTSVYGALTPGRTWKEKVVVKGEYAIAEPIPLESHVVLDLSGAKIVLADGVDDDVIKADSKSDFEIIGGFLDGNKTKQTSGNGIHLLSCSRATVRNVKVTNVKLNGILAESSPQTLIQACRITATGQNGIRVFNGSSYTKVLDCWVGDPNATSNEDKIGWDGIWVDGGSQFCTVARNHVVKALFVGIELDGYSHHCIVADNVIEYCGEDTSDVWPGIKLYGVEGAVVEGNVIKNCYQHGIYSAVNSQDALIVGNSIYENRMHGIWLRNADRTVIAGNKIWCNGTGADNTYSGVKLSDGTVQCIVEANQISNPWGNQLKYGVEEESADEDYNLIVGNVIRDYATQAILKQGAHSVEANNIT